MQYDELATSESLETLTTSLTGNGYDVITVQTGSEALEKIKDLIPEGASVMNGASETLAQIGYIDYLKSGDHPWDDLHAKILTEQEPSKQAALRMQAVLSDYYLGSVHALAETGEYLIASNTGSQLPHVAYTSPNLVFVVSTKKVVPTLEEAMNRLIQYVIPLENNRMQATYGMDTKLSKILIAKGESPFSTRKITFILVEEDLGF